MPRDARSLLVILAFLPLLPGPLDAQQTAYWAGCEAGDVSTLPAYWAEFAPVATKEEAAAWAEADSVGGPDHVETACEILRRGWTERAVRSGVSVEERIELHLERLAVARERYSLAGIGHPPTELLLSPRIFRPEGLDLDDRGLVYVRLGEPDRTATFSGTQSELNRQIPGGGGQWVAAARDLRISPGCYYPNESWAYDYPEETRVYHFSPLDGSADWWLLDNLYRVYHCGDPSRAVSNSSAPILVPHSGSNIAVPAQVAWLVMPDLYTSRRELDSRYQALGMLMLTGGPKDAGEMEGLLNVGLDAVETQQGFSDERLETTAAAEDVLTTVPDRPAVEPDVPVLAEQLQFRSAGAGPEMTTVWLNTIVQGGPLAGRLVGADGFRYAVRATLSLVDEDGELFQRDAVFNVRSPARLGNEAGVPVRLSLDVPPGAYEYTLVLRDANDASARPVGNWRADSLRVRSYAAAVPQLSDIAVAPDSGGPATLAPDVALPVTPVHVTNAERRAWIYFEAYGLSPSGDYGIEVRLQPKDEDEGEAFTLSYRGPPPASADVAVRRVLRLELGDAEPGEYTLRLTVTDALDRTSLPIETDLRVR